MTFQRHIQSQNGPEKNIEAKPRQLLSPILSKAFALIRIPFSIHLINMLIIITLSMYEVQGQTSIARQLVNDKTVQSRLITLTLFNSTQQRAAITYNNPGTNVSLSSQVFIAIAEMNYLANQYDQSGNKFGIHFEVLDPTLAPHGLTLLINQEVNRISQIKLSLLIFTDDYPNLSAFETLFVSYGSGFSNSGTFNAQFSSPTIVPFLYLCDFRLPASSSSFNFQHSVSVTGLAVSTTLVFSGSYVNKVVGYQYLIIYASQFLVQSKPRIQFTAISQPSGTFSFQTTLPQYDPSKTNFLIGLTSFTYGSVMNSSLQALKFIQQLTTNKIVLYVDDQFSAFGYFVLAWNLMGCDSLTHPYVNYNTTSNAYECYDSCPLGKYPNYSVLQILYYCAACTGKCLKCINSTYCESCEPEYDLRQNLTCGLSNRYYVDTGVLHACSELIPDCYQCGSNGTLCLTCLDGFVLNSLGDSCILCDSVVDNCISCSQTICFLCIPGYSLISPLLCQISSIGPPPPTPTSTCASSFCQTCDTSNASKCLKCFQNQNLQLINFQCSQMICGNSKIDSNQICDDGNQFSYDGCSQDCKKIEKGFLCNNVIWNLIFVKSDCYYVSAMKFQEVSVKKINSQNKLKIIFNNPANQVKAWSQISQNQLLEVFTFNIPQVSLTMNSYLYNYSMKFISSSSFLESQRLKLRNLQGVSPSFIPSDYQYLQLTLSYSKNLSQQSDSTFYLNHQQSILTINPQNSGHSQFRVAMPSLLQFPLKTDNNHVIQYYDQVYYKVHLKSIEILSIILAVITNVMIVGAILAFIVQISNEKHMLIALENAFVVQLTYFSLIGQQQLNPLCIVIAQVLKYTSGYDFTLHQNQNTSTINGQLLGASIQQNNFSNNVNLSLIIVVSLVILSLILYFVKRILDKIKSKENINFQYQKEFESDLNNGKCSSSQQKGTQLYIRVFSGVGFGIFLYFSYKFVIFVIVQLKYQSSNISILDIIDLIVLIIIVTIYLILLALKQYLFVSFNQKIIDQEKKSKSTSKQISKQAAYSQNLRNLELKDLSNKNSVSLLQSNIKNNHLINQININKNKQNLLMKNNSCYLTQNSPSSLSEKLGIKKLYPFLIIIAHFINSFCIIILGKYTYWGIAPLVCYIGMIALMLKFRFYDKANQYRFIFNQIIGIIVQIILIVRNILMDDIVSNPGTEQDNLGIYLPYTIILILSILSINSLIFFCYSIKKFRCCDLEIEWEEVDSKARKLYLQNLEKKNKKKQDAKIDILPSNLSNLNQSSAMSSKQNKQITNQMINYETPINKLQQELDFTFQSIFEYAKQINQTQKYERISAENQNNSQRNTSPTARIKKSQIKKQIRESLNKYKIKKDDLKDDSEELILQKDCETTKKHKQYSYTNQKYILDEQFGKI